MHATVRGKAPFQLSASFTASETPSYDVDKDLVKGLDFPALRIRAKLFRRGVGARLIAQDFCQMRKSKMRILKLLQNTATAVSALFLSSLNVFGAVEWEAREIKLVARNEDEKVTGLFKFRNHGPGDVKITSVKTSCGCTNVNLSGNSFAIEQSGTMEVSVKLQKNEKGRKMKTVTMQLEGETEKVVELKIVIIQE